MREDSTDDSRREFMKKGTLAATALAVGAGAASTSATAQEEEEGEVVVHGHDYYPGGEFTVLSQLETLSRTDLLEHLDEDEAVFDDPDDWEVYVIGIEAGEAGPLGHLMVENDEVSPSPGDTGTMDETASIRDPGLNLLELDVTLEEVDEEDDEVDDEEDDEVDDEEDDEVDDEMDDEENDDTL